MARWLVETLQNQAEPGGIWRTVADSPEAWGWVCVQVADIIKGGLNLAPFGTDPFTPDPFTFTLKQSRFWCQSSHAQRPSDQYPAY